MLAYTILWASFVTLLSVFHVNSINYCISSLIMLIVIYNKRYPVKLSPSFLYLLLLVPSLLCWYTIVIYNNFLCIDPLNSGSLTGIFMLYCYLMFLIHYEIKQMTSRLFTPTGKSLVN